MYKSNYRLGSIVGNPHISSKRVVEYSENDYSKNQFGFYRSDFAELMDSQNALDMQRVLQNMQEIQSQESDNSNKSFEEIVALVKPRYIQSPAEMDRFELWCIDNALDTYSKLKQLDDEQKDAIAKAKREDILRVAREMGYEPNNGSSPVGESKIE